MMFVMLVHKKCNYCCFEHVSHDLRLGTRMLIKLATVLSQALIVSNALSGF